MEKEGFDLGLLSEEEAEAYKTTPPLGDEPEPTPADEEKVEKEGEPSPPEKKVESAEAVPEVKPPEPPPEKVPAIDGVLTKDGKNVIPFDVLEKERGKR